MLVPCQSCPTRKTYAKLFDVVIWGEDCPYECEEFEAWKAEFHGDQTKEGTVDEKHEMPLR